jgi:tRNA pseudouridine38-40 synthase
VTAKLVVEYDGSHFAGWAIQPGKRTVQAALEHALRVVLACPDGVPLTVAGRTDAGVHAWAQVASHASEPVADHFDARHDCTSRAYCYRVLARPARGALIRGRALHWSYPYDLTLLRECAALLVGTHDFTAFTPKDTYHVRFDRDIYMASWRTRDPHLLEFWVEADSFMRHMIRALVGTMLDVARGRLSIEHFARLLDGRPRAEAGPTAAAHGLYFAGAGYAGRRLLGHGPGGADPAG